MSFELDSQKKKLLEERVPFWTDQVKKILGASVELSVDLSGFPQDAAKIGAFDQVGLTALRNCFQQLKDKALYEHLAARISKIAMSNDEKLTEPVYQYDAGTKTLRITCTSKQKYWLDFNKLTTFLKQSV